MKKFFNIEIIILTVFCILVWLPVAMIAGGSLMSGDEFAQNLSPVLDDGNGENMARWSIIPQYPTLRFYVELLIDSPGFFVMFWNSCKIVFPILAGQLLICVPAAWGFARYDFRFKNILLVIYLALMLMPFQVTMVSNYLVLDRLNLLNSHLGIIMPAVFSTFPVFIMYRFFRAVPASLLEAAEIDGAGEFKIFIYVGLPMGAPGIVSIIVLEFLEYWSIIEQPLTFLKDKSLWPLSLFLPDIASGSNGLYLAASVVMIIPSLLIFLFGQKYLEKGIRASGLKE
ncbi:MAG TPA: sugar permease [Clostridiales bacterium]|nr:sugar permease [Clostridiales bacterium]